jgi:hypothetical protein
VSVYKKKIVASQISPAHLWPKVEHTGDRLARALEDTLCRITAAYAGPQAALDSPLPANKHQISPITKGRDGAVERQRERQVSEAQHPVSRRLL